MKTGFLFNRKYGAANMPVLCNKKAFANNVYEGFYNVGGERLELPTPWV